MTNNRLRDLITNWNVSRQGRHRILKHHADARAAETIKVNRTAPDKIRGTESRAPADTAIRCQQSHDGQKGLALPRSGFSYHAHTLAPVNRKREVLNGRDFTVGCAEPDVQALELQHMAALSGRADRVHREDHRQPG